MSRTTTVCPECGTTRILSNAGGGMAVDGDRDWTCRMCGAHFEEPKRREKQSKGGINSTTLAGRLADPDVTSVDDLEEVSSE